MSTKSRSWLVSVTALLLVPSAGAMAAEPLPSADPYGGAAPAVEESELNSFFIGQDIERHEMDEATLSDLRHAASTSEDSFKDLVTQHQGVHAFAEVMTKLEERYPDVYTQSGVETGSNTKWVLLTEKPTQDIASIIEQARTRIEVRYGAPASAEDYELAAAAVLEAMGDQLEDGSGIAAGPAADGMTLQVAFDPDIHKPDRVMTAMRDPSVTDHTTASNIPVSLVEEPGLAETTLEVNARGGRTLRRATDGRLMCTSGFAVRRNNGNRGIITARHCPNNLTYGWNQGVITFGSNANRINRGLIDIQFHRINSGHRVSPFFLGSSPRDDRVVRAVANGPVGTVACHYGAATRYSCDRIRLVNRCVSLSGTTYCGLDRTSSHVSAGGDSGGPWFLGNTARGTHTGGGSAGSIFTRIGRVANNMNARVLRRP